MRQDCSVGFKVQISHVGLLIPYMGSHLKYRVFFQILPPFLNIHGEVIEPATENSTSLNEPHPMPNKC